MEFGELRHFQDVPSEIKTRLAHEVANFVAKTGVSPDDAIVFTARLNEILGDYYFPVAGRGDESRHS